MAINRLCLVACLQEEGKGELMKVKVKREEGGCKEMEKMKMSKKPKNKMNEGEEDNGKRRW